MGFFSRIWNKQPKPEVGSDLDLVNRLLELRMAADVIQEQLAERLAPPIREPFYRDISMRVGDYLVTINYNNYVSIDKAW